MPDKHTVTKGVLLLSDMQSLSHSKWRCKYHIVFAPKYRRQVIYRQLRVDIGKILRTLCERKKVEIIEAECCPDHIHMLVSIPPYMSVAGFMGYLKSKSSLISVIDRSFSAPFRVLPQDLQKIKIRDHILTNRNLKTIIFCV